jgi:hypothetical protein
MLWKALLENSEKKENVWASVICNLLIPTILLSESLGSRWLGARWALITALIVPLIYAIWDFHLRRVFNLWSMLMFVSILLSGGLGLLELDGFWFAVKEASVSCLIGILVLFSVRTKTPVVRTLLYNDQLLRIGQVHRAIFLRGNLRELESLLNQINLWLASSFLVSGVLNFALARYLLRSPAGSIGFNSELARLNWWTWPVIVLPCGFMMVYACRKMISGLQNLSGLHPAYILRRGGMDLPENGVSVTPN